MALTPGQQLKQYLIEEKIGEGGMGLVYRARQPSMNRTVAIKIISSAVLSSPDMLARFQRELEIIAQLEHPHILPVYDFGEVENNPFIVMRYLGGGTLQERLRAGLMSHDALLRSLEQIAEALDYAHEKNVVHRDLKPGNILFDQQGNAYLADFGIAKVTVDDSDLTVTGSLVGTPVYMSPEQARGEKLDGRSDIYSLSIVAYQALAGRLPFEAQSAWEWIDSHLSAPVPSILTAAPELPPAVDQVLQWGLAKRPQDRPEKATELIQALQAAVSGTDSALIPLAAAAASKTTFVGGQTSPQMAGATLARDEATTIAPPPSPPAAGRAIPWLWLGAGVGLILLIGLTLLLVSGGVFLFAQQGRGPAVHTYPAGDSPRALAFDGESMWVANFFDNTLIQLQATGCQSGNDPCGQPLGVYPVDDLPVALAYDDRVLWVASALGGTLSQIDPASGQIIEQRRLPNLPSVLLLHEESLWISHAFAGKVSQVDLQGNVQNEYMAGQSPLGLAIVEGYLWVANQESDTIQQIEPATGETRQTISLPGRPGALVFDGLHLWVGLEGESAVAQINVTNGEVIRQISVERRPVALLFDGQYLWTANETSNLISQIDVNEGRVARTIRVPGGPFALAWVSCGPNCGDLWVAGQNGDTVSRVRIE